MQKCLKIFMALEKKSLRELNNGKNVVFDIDWQGAEQIKKKT